MKMTQEPPCLSCNFIAPVSQFYRSMHPAGRPRPPHVTGDDGDGDNGDGPSASDALIYLRRETKNSRGGNNFLSNSQILLFFFFSLGFHPKTPTYNQQLLLLATSGTSVGTPVTLKSSTWKTQRPGTLTLEVLVMLMMASVWEPGML